MKPFSDSEMVKECLIAAFEVMQPECKRNPHNDLTPSRFSTARRIEEIWDDIFNTLTERVKAFKWYSTAIDEATDIGDISQLAVFVRGIDERFVITRANQKLQQKPEKSCIFSIKVAKVAILILEQFF
jgi:hypothetical protein